MQHELPRPERGGRQQARRAAVSLLKAFGPLQRRVAPIDVRDQEIRRILLIRLDLLGDLVLTMPAAAYLRDRYPNAELHFLTLPYTAPLLTHYPWVDRVLAFDVNRLRPSGEWRDRRAWEEAAALIQAIRAAEYDVVIGFCGAWASAIALLSGAPATVGYAGEGLRNAYSIALPGERYDRPGHEVEWCLRAATSAAARRVVGPAARYSPVRYGFDGLASLAPIDAAARSVGVRLAAHGVRDADAIAVLHPGARNGAAKRWHPEGLAATCDRLRAEGVVPVLTGAKSEAELTAAVSRAARSRVIDLAGQTTIPELVALLARASIVISGDSAPLHLAVALGRPVVALHGPTSPEISGPWGGRSVIVRNPLPCMPCYDATDPAECPLGHHRCLRELGVDTVWQVVRDAIERG